ncbi:hypothetical protein NP233_g3724 [Leucocoprinus birnbaumii]|uniref:DUF7918 domain-containing protein n=1 Tax=Leucocoprinus birnbaumii TaxID=56174 RepID=A0AAD5YY54_9AGAR|nr:hypothetical protein NP233_g3724 [Leucocoprinus birnbaumii]
MGLAFEDDDNLLQASRKTLIGEIEIRCRYFAILSKKQEDVIYRAGFGSMEKLHEKAKKGISQRIGLGKTIKQDPVITYTPEWKEDIVTFSFRYRPLNWLQAQGIAPPPPKAPSPAPELDLTQPVPGPKRRPKRKVKVEEEPVEISDDDEEDEEVQRLLAQVEEIKSRKRKQRQETVSSPKRVKQEELTKLLDGEVIDLT